MDESWRGIVQVQRLTEVGELLRTQGATAAAVETVKNFLQALLGVVLPLAVVHPTGQQPALQRTETEVQLEELTEPSVPARQCGRNTWRGLQTRLTNRRGASIPPAKFSDVAFI